MTTVSNLISQEMLDTVIGRVVLSQRGGRNLKIFPRHALFPAAANTQSFQTSIVVSVMAERGAVCNLPMGLRFYSSGPRI